MIMMMMITIIIIIIIIIYLKQRNQVLLSLSSFYAYFNFARFCKINGITGRSRFTPWIRS